MFTPPLRPLKALSPSEWEHGAVYLPHASPPRICPSGDPHSAFARRLAIPRRNLNHLAASGHFGHSSPTALIASRLLYAHAHTIPCQQIRPRSRATRHHAGRWADRVAHVPPLTRDSPCQHSAPLLRPHKLPLPQVPQRRPDPLRHSLHQHLVGQVQLPLGHKAQSDRLGVQRSV